MFSVGTSGGKAKWIASKGQHVSFISHNVFKCLVLPFKRSTTRLLLLKLMYLAFFAKTNIYVLCLYTGGEKE